MSYVEEARQRAKEIRHRLMYPPNAVPDPGIDLKRGIRIPPPEPQNPVPPEVEEPEQPKPNGAYGARVTVLEYPIIRKPPLVFNHILQLVSENTGKSIEDIQGPIRKADLVVARRITAHLAHKLLPNRSVSSIGRAMKKDHSSVLHGLREFPVAMASNIELSIRVSLLEEILRAHYHCRPALASDSQQNLAQRQQESLSQPEI